MNGMNTGRDREKKREFKEEKGERQTKEEFTYFFLQKKFINF